jgi:hypothetical protein
MTAKRVIIGFCLVFILILYDSATAFSEIKVFDVAVEEIVGRDQSQEQVEAFALQKAKRLAVEKAGTYISSLTVVRNYRLARDEITALASGIVRTEIVGIPSVTVKNGIVHVRVKARIQVDTQVLEKQVEALLEDQSLLAKLKSEQQRVRELERQLASLKSTELKSLEELNRQAIALEMEHENQRLFREEQRLKAQKEIAKAELDILKQEQTRATRFAELQNEQEASRREELQRIAREQNRIRKAHLENESYWRELARKAELSQTNWIPIDDTLSLKQAIGEVRDLRVEIANIKERMDFQLVSSRENLNKAYNQQISITQPIEFSGPEPKDPFESSAEYNQRLKAHRNKVQNYQRENKLIIYSLKYERDLKIIELEITALERQIQILRPFNNRLEALQNRRFDLPKEMVTVILHSPDADRYYFPVTLEYNGNTWTKYWNYDDRKQARAFWNTRSYLRGHGLFQLEIQKHDSINHRITAVKVSHPGTRDERVFKLETPSEFPEIRAFKNLISVELPEAYRKLEDLETRNPKAIWGTWTSLNRDGFYMEIKGNTGFFLDKTEPDGEFSGEIALKNIGMEGVNRWTCLCSYKDIRSESPSWEECVLELQGKYLIQRLPAKNIDFWWQRD